MFKVLDTVCQPTRATLVANEPRFRYLSLDKAIEAVQNNIKDK